MPKVKPKTAWAIADERGQLMANRGFRSPNLFDRRRDALDEIDDYSLDDCVPVRVIVTATKD